MEKKNNELLENILVSLDLKKSELAQLMNTKLLAHRKAPLYEQTSFHDLPLRGIGVGACNLLNF